MPRRVGNLGHTKEFQRKTDYQSWPMEDQMEVGQRHCSLADMQESAAAVAGRTKRVGLKHCTVLFQTRLGYIRRKEECSWSGPGEVDESQGDHHVRSCHPFGEHHS